MLGVKQDYADAGDPKRQKIDSKILMLYLVGQLDPPFEVQYSKEDKLSFAFNLFDEEDSRVITYLEVKKILIASELLRMHLRIP